MAIRHRKRNDVHESWRSPLARWRVARFLSRELAEDRMIGPARRRALACGKRALGYLRTRDDLQPVYGGTPALNEPCDPGLPTWFNMLWPELWSEAHEAGLCDKSGHRAPVCPRCGDHPTRPTLPLIGCAACPGGRRAARKLASLQVKLAAFFEMEQTS